jgi:glycosyl transferase family 25
VRAYVISLPRSRERRVFIVRELSRVGADYEIVDGVDGRQLDLSDPEVVDEGLRSARDFQPGVVGCALSHLRVYNKVLESGAASGLVLEDDVVLPDDFRAMTSDVASRLRGAEVALLNYQSAEPCRLTTQGAVQLGPSRQVALPVTLRRLNSTAAYIITRGACERMAKLVLPVRTPADDWAFYYQEGGFDRLYCVAPIAVQKAPEFRSTIDWYPAGSVQGRVREFVARKKLPVLYQVLAYRRRRFQRQWSRVDFVNSPSELSIVPVDSLTDGPGRADWGQPATG